MGSSLVWGNIRGFTVTEYVRSRDSGIFQRWWAKVVSPYIGLAWLRPKPGLLAYIYNFALFDLEINVNIFSYMSYSVITLFYSFLSAGHAESCKNCEKSHSIL